MAASLFVSRTVDDTGAFPSCGHAGAEGEGVPPDDGHAGGSYCRPAGALQDGTLHYVPEDMGVLRLNAHAGAVDRPIRDLVVPPLRE